MAAVQRKTSRLCARAHRPLAHPAAYSHAEARKSWQRDPDSAHAWLLELLKAKPATRGTPPRTLLMGKGPLLSPQMGGEDPQPPKGGWGDFPPKGGGRNHKAEQSSEEHSRAEQMLQLFPRCHQSINQSINQSSNETINQSINHTLPAIIKESNDTRGFISA